MSVDIEMEKTVAIAKSAPATKTKSEWYRELKKFSNRRRLAGESPEQAFAKFISDADGRDMYRAYKMAKGASVPAPEEPDEDDKGAAGPSEAMETIRTIAALLMREDPSLSKQQATAKALQTPAGAAAYLRDKQDRLRRAG
jgi:hypothetical protein